MENESNEITEALSNMTITNDDETLQFPSEIIGNVYKKIKEGNSILLSGPGGTGKSFCIRWIAKQLLSEGVNVTVTATTGVAALNLSDNDDLPISTLHSFAGVGTAEGSAEQLLKRLKVSHKANWKSCKILIIDEVSMLGANFFNKLDYIAKSVRKSQLPFGGIALILSGDFLQLPPVKDDWVYASDAWTSLNLFPFVFSIPYRYIGFDQSGDNDFFELLQRVRIGEPTERDIKIINIRKKTYHTFQGRFAKMSEEQKIKTIQPTMFHSRRNVVEQYNESELEKLKGKSFTFKATDLVVPRYPNIDIGEWREHRSEEEFAKIFDESIPRVVVLKVGAQVMIKKNIDLASGLANGSRGVVLSIKGDLMGIKVKLVSGREVDIGLYDSQMYTKYSRASRIQIPVVLSYALTIHKAQGSTLDYATINLGSSIFAPGQAYVALSRCKNISGLFVSDFTPASIIANGRSIEYSRRINFFARVGVNIHASIEEASKICILVSKFRRIPEDIRVVIKRLVINTTLIALVTLNIKHSQPRRVMDIDTRT